ncbi:MAG TPA: adenylyltransferase/cytidyltransferase family protein [Flavobacteriales bacterium]|nr:adenylyltransferase/cytidyltransferase family protein [Flavobacteriales bacterium]MCC6655235.1 adenylyltransferase/cytidyltransferase family protein [Flavobacteriales bacterium]HMU12947.1 adenylyltransferase/cytidyltransferase family protein [Flavobacteriales bacterium]HNK85387.1 adenylyltransferase/cytidyltransferase family protein [Flavobacteriales bacterium]HNM70058.1 adenylyltransferase/cytidyltransferase family protein [Flavobacteriales bacterium]
MPRAFVSGCFDLLHSGHVAFLKSAAAYGELHVCIGSDATIHALKKRWTINDANERRYMLEALSCVHEVHVGSGSGQMDFVPEFLHVKPDFLVVNADGHAEAKAALCEQHGVRYVVLERTPHEGLKARSTTDLRATCTIPFRIDLAGGWLDQPYVAKHHGGSVLTISIEPTHAFNDRSGMSSSTRKKAIELWGTHLPDGDREKHARLLFASENPPGTVEVSGSQDSIGIVYPGLNRLHYDGNYWPERIESVQDEDVLHFIEEHLQLVPLEPRAPGFSVLEGTHIEAAGAKALADAADACWSAVLAKDAVAFGAAFRRSFEAQVAMFPHMVDEDIRAQIARHADDALGWKLSGAGGGGYLILVRKETLPGTLRITIRRSGW